MKRTLFVTALMLAMVSSGVAVSAAPRQVAAPLDLYEARVAPGDDVRLRDLGYDVVGTGATADEQGKAALRLELVLTREQAEQLRARGVDVELVTDTLGRSASRAATLQLQDGAEVWRSYSEPGGIEDEIRSLAQQHPDLLKLVNLGPSGLGRDILALKLTSNANRVFDGRRPAVLHVSLQHAREWITVEVNRRLLHHYLEHYGEDPAVTELVDTTELWFVLVANPDGYDLTFTEDNRLWRKNVRDNDGDGQLSPADGVDLNRNFATRWGYDNEGSSPEPANQTYRGPEPGSEPETQALDELMRRVDFEFLVNYHSAAELLLYGVGWQVATPSPDDAINVALTGDDGNSAIPGYDPDLSAELYTTNGDTTDHAHVRYGTLAFTPELDTCDAAEAIFPDDEYGETYCEDAGRSVFEFPDDEELVEAVFAKNLPFALALARSAEDPADPESPVGANAPDFVVDEFSVSYGDPQTVAVVTKRRHRDLAMHYTINGGPVQLVRPQEWNGGERYGEDYDVYYAEYRAQVRGAEPGDEVTVWFEAADAAAGSVGTGPPSRLASEAFTYTLAGDSDAPVLVVANEDYQGFGPEQDLDAPAYVDAYADALAAGGIAFDVWDVTRQGVPHDLGVLGHYDAVVWELGDNRLTQEEEDVVTETPLGDLPDLSVAESQQYLTMSIRDYLNEGGKLLQAGEYAAYYGILAGALGGAYYGLDGAPEADCVVTDDFFSDCLIFSDDFSQYYQGVYLRDSIGAPQRVQGVDRPLSDLLFDVDGAQTPDSGAFMVTSDVLPPAQFPQFTSWASAQYDQDEPFGFQPFSGEHYAAALHTDAAWMRLARTIDLTDASTASLSTKLSYDTEPGYDHVLIEARAVGTQDWTTLPDQVTDDGGTSTTVPTECEVGFLLDLHPALMRYLTPGDPCAPTGETGEWHAFSGDSGGWTDVEVDLSAYAGDEVEVAISYVTDPGTGGLGVFLDDTALTVDGDEVDANGFEDSLGSWSVPGAPEGSPGNATDWERSSDLFGPPAAVVSTEDTVTFGFGLEAIASPDVRVSVVRRVLEHLLDEGP